MIKLPPIPRPILKLFRSPLVVISAASLGVRIGKDIYKMRKGEIDSKEFRARTGTNFGSVTGGMAGAAAGAAAFSVLPGVGTVLGAFAGGMLGEAVGSKLGRRAADRLEEAAYSDKKAEEAAPSSETPPQGSGPKRHI